MIRHHVEVKSATRKLSHYRTPDYMEWIHRFEDYFFRKTKARTLDRLEQAVAQALAIVTSQDAHGCFRQCGYVIH